MTGERSYTTKIWRLPSSIGFSSADALSTSMDPPGAPVITTRKRPCQKIQNGSEFPELVAQNSRNPQHCENAWLGNQARLSLSHVGWISTPARLVVHFFQTSLSML